MRKKLSYALYFIITFTWSFFTFLVLLSEFKNFVYPTCVWTFSFHTCDRIIGIEGAYRFTISVALFYIVLAFLTLNINPIYSSWFQYESWLLKISILLICNVIGFIIPFTRLIVEVLYYIVLTIGILYVIVMFILLVDAGHAFKLFWLRKANENKDVPTCYMGTWLFVLHLITSLQYAVSIDLLLAFFFFNNTEECIFMLIYALVNAFLCLVAFGISYFPTLRDRQCTSQIVYSNVLSVVSFSTWLTVSDPENEFCNMYGTIFTGSLLDSSESFKCFVALTYTVISLIYMCWKGNALSYTRSLISNNGSDDFTLHIYSIFHFAMVMASCFILMSVTNFYKPVYTLFKSLPRKTRNIRTSIVYFEGYDRYRFILLGTITTILPLMYITLLIIRIIKDTINQKKQLRTQEEQSDLVLNKEQDSKDSSCVFNAEHEFIYIPVDKSKALYMLKHKHSHDSFEITDRKTDFLLLPCFAMLDRGLSFWHFPRFVSQTYFKGRNGSNACTIIAIIFGRFFARSDIPFQQFGYLGDTWIKLFYESIEEGSILYDSIVKELGVLDLSIEEVCEKFGNKLNIRHILPSLAVSFASDIESVTIKFQLERLMRYRRKKVVLFIHKMRTSAFLIYDDDHIIYADSHAFGENGSILMSCDVNNLTQFVDFLRDLLGENENKLSTLTEIEYEDRWSQHNKLY